MAKKTTRETTKVLTDTKMLDWLYRNASKLGIRPDWIASIHPSDESIEYTDFRAKIKTHMMPNAAGELRLPDHDSKMKGKNQ